MTTPAAARVRRSDRPGALRARRHRARRAAGLVPRQVEVDEDGLAAMLIATGRLSEAESARRDLQERELSVLVADLILRWRNGVTR